MALYKFKVTDQSGKIFEYVCDGENEKEARSRLKAQKLRPLQFLGITQSAEIRKGFHFGNDFDVCDFTARLEPLLTAHIPLERALGIIADGMENEGSINVVHNLRRGLHEGKKFSHLIRGQGKYFPDLYANLVEAGEEAGILATVVQELRRYLENRREVKNFLVSSSIYPLFILFAVFAVVILLFVWFLPKFADIFVKLRKPMPPIMENLMGISNFFVSFWWLWLLLIIGGVAAYFVLRQKEAVCLQVDKMKLKIPLFGNMLKTAETARFVRTLAILLQNHVHLLNCVTIALKSVQNRAIASTFSTLVRDLRSGSKLSQALAKSPYIDRTTLQMLTIGEESGNTGDMLNQVASFNEAQLRIKIKRLLAIMEPAMILVLAMIVFVVVLAIFQSINSLNQ